MTGLVVVAIILGAYVGLMLFLAEFCAEQEAPTPPFKPRLHVNPPADGRWSEAETRWREHRGNDAA